MDLITYAPEQLRSLVERGTIIVHENGIYVTSTRQPAPASVLLMPKARVHAGRKRMQRGFHVWREYHDWIEIPLEDIPHDVS